jgi:hypothetical protein
MILNNSKLLDGLVVKLLRPLNQGIQTSRIAQDIGSTTIKQFGHRTIN